MWFQVEEVLEKIKMGFDPQKSFTKMDKNRNVKDRIRGQVMRLNPPVMQRPRKKSEVGIPRLRRTWDWKMTVSFFPSWGTKSPKDFRQWTTSRGWRRFSSTRPRSWKSEHLLALQPSVSVGSTTPPAFPFPWIFLGAIRTREQTFSLHARWLAKWRREWKLEAAADWTKKA